jgi:hypothetical protein
MDQPIWLVVPWLVFALAAALKAWKIGLLINQQLRRNQLSSQLGGTALGIERFRAELELGWRRSHQNAQNK